MPTTDPDTNTARWAEAVQEAQRRGALTTNNSGLVKVFIDDDNRGQPIPVRPNFLSTAMAAGASGVQRQHLDIIGQGPKTSVFQLAPSGAVSAPLYFYDALNSTTVNTRLRFSDVGFIGLGSTINSSPAWVRRDDLLPSSDSWLNSYGFRLEDQDKAWEFERCYFRGLRQIMGCEGTANGDRMRFRECKADDSGTWLYLNNAQSVSHVLDNCSSYLSRRHFIEYGANGGGSVELYSPEITTEMGDPANADPNKKTDNADGTLYYLVYVPSGAVAIDTSGGVTFHNILCELRGRNYGIYYNVSSSGTTGELRTHSCRFLGGKFSPAPSGITGSGTAQTRKAADVGMSKSLVFDGVTFPQHDAVDSDALNFYLRSSDQSSGGSSHLNNVGHHGEVVLNNCLTAPGVCDRIRRFRHNGAASALGRAIVTNTRIHTGPTPTAYGYEDYIAEPRNRMPRCPHPNRRFTARVKNHLDWPDTATTVKHEITLPKCIIRAARFRKEAGSGGGTFNGRYALRIKGSGQVLCETANGPMDVLHQAQWVDSSANAPVIVTGTTPGQRIVELVAIYGGTGPSITALAHAGYAEIEYEGWTEDWTGA